jgi:hypothetical protein
MTVENKAARGIRGQRIGMLLRGWTGNHLAERIVSIDVAEHSADWQ